jgi:DNA-binding LytR/AlgR family response regulator
MIPVRILIVEDDLLIAHGLATSLQHAGYSVSGNVTSSQEALAAVSTAEPDLVIMDINLRGPEDGIACALAIQEKHDMPVIFLTDVSTPDALKRASKVRYSTYLLKPFSERQLFVSIEDALFKSGQVVIADEADALMSAVPAMLTDCVFMRLDNVHFKKILLKDILFLEADGSYSVMHTEGGKAHTFCVSLITLHAKLTHPTFVRVSRSAVVNISRIDEVKGNTLIVAGHSVPIGDKFRANLVNALPMLR